MLSCVLHLSGAPPGLFHAFKCYAVLRRQSLRRACGVACVKCVLTDRELRTVLHQALNKLSGEWKDRSEGSNSGRKARQESL